jgi:hypothetical protein
MPLEKAGCPHPPVIPEGANGRGCDYSITLGRAPIAAVLAAGLPRKPQTHIKPANHRYQRNTQVASGLSRPLTFS